MTPNGTLTWMLKPPERILGTVLRTVPFLACVGALVGETAVGPGGRRVGAVFALAGVTASVVLVAHGVRTNATTPVTLPRAGVQAAARTWFAWSATAVVLIAEAFKGVGAAAVAGGAVLALVVGVALVPQSLRELDKEIALRATSIAFFTTMAAAVVYAMFESVAGAPHLSMWVVWSFGMGAWAVSSVALWRHYR